MRSRLLALGLGLGLVSLGGCLKILGDYDLDGSDAAGAGAHGAGVVPCWTRPSDGLCFCGTAPDLDAGFASSAGCSQPGDSNGWKCCRFQGTDCTCAAFRCLAPKDNPLSCTCGHYARLDAGSDWEERSYCSGAGMGGGPGCCAGQGICYCNGDGCGGGATGADHCDVGEFASSVACGGGGQVVGSCP
jgi:hypothetical protein